MDTVQDINNLEATPKAREITLDMAIKLQKQNKEIGYYITLKKEFLMQHIDLVAGTSRIVAKII